MELMNNTPRLTAMSLLLLIIMMCSDLVFAQYPGLPGSIIAHRGASALAPENTMAAFKKASKLNIHFVEFDVMVSPADPYKTPFIFHDKTLNRTTNGKGDVAKYSFAELRKLDAGAWFSPRFSGEKIPGLQEVARFLFENGMSANVEIKPLSGMDEITAEQAFNVIKQYFPQSDSRILYSSFSIKSLRHLRKLCTQCHLAVLFKEWQDDWQEIAKSLKVVSINLKDKLVTKSRVDQIKAAGYQVSAYTIDSKKQAKMLFNFGVDAVFTNTPGKLKSMKEVAR